MPCGCGATSSDRLSGRLPAHAEGQPVDRRTPRGRAAWNLLLVLEDAGAGAHNLGYARRLLASAEDLLTGARPEDRP
jgi:hypothetical protein